MNQNVNLNEDLSLEKVFQERVLDFILDYEKLSTKEKIEAIQNQLKKQSWWRTYQRLKLTDKDKTNIDSRREKIAKQRQVKNWDFLKELVTYIEQFLNDLKEKANIEAKKEEDKNIFKMINRRGEDEYLESEAEIIDWLKKHTKRIDLIIPKEPDEAEMNELGSNQKQYKSILKAREDAFDYIDSCKNKSVNFEPKESNQIANSFELILDSNKNMPLTLKNGTIMKNIGLIGQYEERPLYNVNSNKITSNNYIRYLIDNYGFYLGEQPK